MATVGVQVTPPAMYRVRPYFVIKKVKLPDCMYMVRSLHQLPDMAPSNEGMSSALSYLEQRQERVLTQLSLLQGRVKALGEKLGISPAEVLAVQQATPKGAIHDVVISCPPSAPPYALLTLYRLVSSRLPAACRVHIHSSVVESAGESLREFFKGLNSDCTPRMRLTLVWKSESFCRAPTMLISPHNQTPVQGIANITRYLCRQFCPELYENLGPEVAGKIDSWLDSVTVTLQYGSSKEKTAVMRRLNSHLGSSSYLAGGQCSLADVVAYTVLCSDSTLKATGNVKQWMKRCQELPEFANIPCSYLVNSDNS